MKKILSIISILFVTILFPVVSFGATGDSYQYCYNMGGSQTLCPSFADRASCVSAQNARTAAGGVTIISSCPSAPTPSGQALVQATPTGQAVQQVSPPTTPANGILDIIVEVSIKTGILVGFILFALKTTKKLSDEIGGHVASWAQKGFGMVAGGALGATALAGRSTIGRLAQNRLDKGTIQERASKKGVGGFIARRELTLTKGTAEGSMDFRTTAAGKLADKSAGLNLGEGKKGGFKAARDTQTERELAYAKSLEVSPSEDLMREKNRADAEHKMAQDAVAAGDTSAAAQQEVARTKAAKDAAAKAVADKNKERRSNYANVAEGRGSGAGYAINLILNPTHSGRTARDAANRIRTGTAPKRKSTGDPTKDTNTTMQDILDELKKFNERQPAPASPNPPTP